MKNVYFIVNCYVLFFYHKETLIKPSTATTTSKQPGGGDDEEPFDEIDNMEVQNARNESLSTPESPPPLLGTRNSSIFKGMRARENYIKIHLTAREKEFTELYPFT